jgi:nucleoside-diphosphate-sugar epimerase
MKKILCGVIGVRGYLGRQLSTYIAQRDLPIQILPFSRELQQFLSGKYEGQHHDVLLNFGTPNEVVARQGGTVAQKAIAEWSDHFLSAVRLAEPTRCMHISTFHIFGVPDGVMNEESSLIGGNAYGNLHITCLDLVKRICSGKDIVLSTIIPTNIFGTVALDLIPRTDLILNLAIELLREMQTLSLRSNGSGVRDFLWIEDALEALCQLILQTPCESQETVVVASEKSLSVREALEALFSVLGKGTFGEWCKWGAALDPIKPFFASSQKLRDLIGGWHPKSILEAARSQQIVFNKSK